MESGDDETPSSGKSQPRKIDIMRQCEFWGITGTVWEQLTGVRAPKVGVLRPFYAVAQESYFNYIDRPWEEVRQHYFRKYSFELHAEEPANRDAIVLDWALRCFKASSSTTEVSGDKSSQSAAGKTADEPMTAVEPSDKRDKGATHKEKASGRAGADSDEDLEREHARFMKAHERES